MAEWLRSFRFDQKPNTNVLGLHPGTPSKISRKLFMVSNFTNLFVIHIIVIKFSLVNSSEFKLFPF